MDLDDACTLMALLNDKRPVAVGHVLSGWDMLQVDVPSRERVENAASVLVGSGLAQLDEGWSLRLTAQGGSAVPPGQAAACVRCRARCGTTSRAAS